MFFSTLKVAEKITQIIIASSIQIPSKRIETSTNTNRRTKTNE